MEFTKKNFSRYYLSIPLGKGEGGGGVSGSLFFAILQKKIFILLFTYANRIFTLDLLHLSYKNFFSIC